MYSFLHGDGKAKTRRAARDVGGGQRRPRSVNHPFYETLNGLLAEHGFDEFVGAQCRPFHAEWIGRPSLVPGQ